MSVHLQQVADIVLRESGIRVRPTQLSALEATLHRVQRDMTPTLLLRTLEDPESGPGLLERLIDAVTVKETYFLRNTEELELIDWPARLVAAMASGSAMLRVWNPACATGEETYSLAMLALEALGPSAPVSILATDIAPGALMLAEEGIYGLRALRNVGAAARGRHFDRHGDHLRMGAGPRGLVRFATHNLVRDPIPPAGEGPFDVIVCRNVLIYFDPETAASTADAFTSALAPGGMLVLGAADTLAVMTGRSQMPRALPKTTAAGTQHPRPPRQRTSASETHRPDARRSVRTAPIRDGHERVSDEDLSVTLARTESMLAADALDPIAHFLRGLAERARDDTSAAVASFRRALYADPDFARCAFELGRTYEQVGDLAAARRAYLSALNALKAGAQPERLLENTDLVDLLTACRARLQALHRGDASVPIEARVILAVDDSALVREVVKVGLPPPAWQVLSVDSGNEALAVAAQAQPDAILLDVVMPGLDGPATFERLRAIPLTRDIPIVFLTGRSEASDRERLCALGADGVIAKPFDPAVLAERLSATLGWQS